MERIVPLEFPAIDNFDIVAQRSQQQFDLARVVLRVAVGVEDQVFATAGEADPQRAAVAERLAVGERLEVVVLLL